MRQLLDELDREHTWIEQEISVLQRFTLEDTVRLLELLNFVEIHHRKEEQQLFPWIARQPWLPQGGPKCTYFMGLRLEFNPAAPALTLIKEFAQLYPSVKIKNDDEYDWLKPSSPLSIPMEEHRLGDQLKASVLYLLAHDPHQFTSDQFLGKRLLNKYLELLKTHLTKERDCLFVMCRQRIA